MLILSYSDDCGNDHNFIGHTVSSKEWVQKFRAAYRGIHIQVFSKYWFGQKGEKQATTHLS